MLQAWSNRLEATGLKRLVVVTSLSLQAWSHRLLCQACIEKPKVVSLKRLALVEKLAPTGLEQRIGSCNMLAVWKPEVIGLKWCTHGDKPILTGLKPQDCATGLGLQASVDRFTVQGFLKANWVTSHLLECFGDVVIFSCTEMVILFFFFNVAYWKRMCEKVC